MKLSVITGAVLLASTSAFAQDEHARRAAAEVAARVPLEKAMKGGPYSAETIVEGTQTLADGNRINQKTTGRVYRDGEGRTRREEDRPNGAVMISITDPVGGYTYSLDTNRKVAWRTPLGTAGLILDKIEAVRTQADDGRRKVEFEQSAAVRGTNESRMKEVEVARGAVAGPLQHKTLEGVPVEGRKTTTIIPAGQIGNEQPLTITSEQWRSPDLNVLVMTRHVDPRTGESTYRLVNIIRAEPDRSLFMVPPDYTVKDTGIRKMLEAAPRK